MQVPTSALPIGQEISTQDLVPEQLDADSLVITQNSVLALSHSELKKGAEALYESPLKGYIFVSNIDEVKSKVTLLVPLGGQLPPNIMIMGEFKWQSA